MTTKQAVCATVALGAGMAAYSASVYRALPQKVPTHWNVYGQVDDWMPKAAAAFVMLPVALLLALLLAALPYLGRRQITSEAFRGVVNYLVVLFAGLMAYGHGIMLYAGLHPQEDSGRWLVAGIFVFLGLVGSVVGKMRHNAMGFRTTWSAADERLWTVGHRLAARIMVAGGFAGAVAVLLGAPQVVCFILVMAALVTPVIYARRLYRYPGKAQID